LRSKVGVLLAAGILLLTGALNADVIPVAGNATTPAAGHCGSMFCESNDDNESFALWVARVAFILPAGINGTADNAVSNPEINANIDFNTLDTSTYDKNPGSDITRAAFAPTPEPSSIILLCTTLGGLGLLARKKLRG